MASLYKRANPSQRRILRIVEGAVKNACDAHPGQYVHGSGWARKAGHDQRAATFADALRAIASIEAELKGRSSTVEHQTLTLGVAGSSPAVSAKSKRHH